MKLSKILWYELKILNYYLMPLKNNHILANKNNL